MTGNIKKIGIIGFGRFGKLMTGYLAQDFEVFVYNRSDKTSEIRKIGAYPTSLAEVCEQDMVILTVPISMMNAVLKEISPLLRKDAVVTDVCSVKEYPVRWMEELLPETVSILATHPMFGPDSAADSLRKRKIVLCRKRIEDALYNKIKSYLSAKGLIVIETTPEEHDRQIAVSLALTHFIGRTLSEYGASELDIDTEGYKRLLHILGVVEHDTWQLFVDMHKYNPYAKGERIALTEAMKIINEKLEEK
ncbi:prephenate dehydrogenase/arogenate dehydrogenase family protein [Desulfonema magnum]|uniref:Prephenate dehydratase family protein n=1 Tax=Desulfonema magnum TaxID=45655 RepID=A0A975BKG9_9BACT|nr:prephenate dehydrogenase/arogenate dehydrogenase family protein [Desulfonema magnum]QTA87095.1 Prephenate dehydratase family protein [Desulfonema magnum]